MPPPDLEQLAAFRAWRVVRNTLGELVNEEQIFPAVVDRHALNLLGNPQRQFPARCRQRGNATTATLAGWCTLP